MFALREIKMSSAVSLTDSANESFERPSRHEGVQIKD